MAASDMCVCGRLLDDHQDAEERAACITRWAKWGIGVMHTQQGIQPYAKSIGMGMGTYRLATGAHEHATQCAADQVCSLCDVERVRTQTTGDPAAPPWDTYAFRSQAERAAYGGHVGGCAIDGTHCVEGCAVSSDVLLRPGCGQEYVAEPHEHIHVHAGHPMHSHEHTHIPDTEGHDGTLSSIAAIHTRGGLAG